jgi:hypothetical protein
VLTSTAAPIGCQLCCLHQCRAPPRAAAPASQVVHLLLSHKRSMRGMPLVEGMVQALGADMPLGNADVAGERLSAWWQGRVRYQVGS